MKIQKIEKKGKGLRAILCLLLSVMCIAVMDISVRAEVNMTDYPGVYLSPDGSEWTTYDELPYCENYHVADFATDYKFPFWTEGGRIIETGEISRKTDPGVGQHRYNFERRGEVPVLYWKCIWENGRCIHDGLTFELLGITEMDTYKCGDAYWSGLQPYCAYCEGAITNYIHYIKPETAAGIKWLDLEKGYFYLCPHGGNHDGAKVEQSFERYEHTCSDISYNQYKG